MHIMPIMTTRNKGNKSSSRSLARFCRRKHKESTAHPSCSTCRQVYIMRNLVRNLSKFVSKPRESRVALGTRMNGSTLSTLSFIRLAPSGRKNVMSMRQLFRPDPLTGFEKMAGFQIFYCLKMKCFHS